MWGGRELKAHVSAVSMNQRVKCKQIKLSTQGPPSSDGLSLARPNHLHLPKQSHQLGSECSNALECGEHFSFEPLHPVLLYSVSLLLIPILKKITFVLYLVTGCNAVCGGQIVCGS